MGTREDAERKHDEIKLRALDTIQTKATEEGIALTARERLLISMAAEAGIIAAVEWMTESRGGA